MSLFGATEYLAAGLGAIAGGVVMFGLTVGYFELVTIPATKIETRATVNAEARERAIDLMKKRSKDNAEISNFDLQQFCAEYGGKWVQNNCVN
jgi:hypothetical protein